MTLFHVNNGEMSESLRLTMCRIFLFFINYFIIVIVIITLLNYFIIVKFSLCSYLVSPNIVMRF